MTDSRTWLAIDAGVSFGSFALDIQLEATASTLVLLGQNGAGKTTLLRLLLGAISPQRGRVVLDDVVLYDGPQGSNVPIEERRIAYVPHHYGLFPHLDVRANVGFGVPRSQREPRVREVIAQLHLDALASRLPHQLSSGERQRVALARALAAQPRALLLDEPLGALDAASREEVRSHLVATLAALALPTIVVTHDLADARALGGDVAVLEAGKVVAHGPLDRVLATPTTPFLRTLAAQG